MRGGLASLAACCALVAPLAGCGGDESSPRADTARSVAATKPPPTQTRASAEPRLDTVHGLAPNPWKEPAQRSLRAHPHAQLDRVVVRDLEKGRGAAARPHDYVFVDYILADYRRAYKFYRAWGGPPYETGGVILTPTERWRGLVVGMTGMRPGGRRRILAPPRLSGTELGHDGYRTVLYWDVVLRKILARGCADDGSHCRSIAS